ncbi:hypothetical protein A3843_09960 [Pseudovibrio exalbescens]|uniref:Uncharacterized protein n=1 Tax=Pseudovibrio exalbescens TaxID=197461 RepID=A0A1U7JGU0_9HYPH|nr:hypothetical protein A3843_09960 [Pseudovibrio exalbescens]
MTFSLVFSIHRDIINNCISNGKTENKLLILCFYIEYIKDKFYYVKLEFDQFEKTQSIDVKVIKQKGPKWTFPIASAVRNISFKPHQLRAAFVNNLD